jgi:NAD(P)-dependent dehydrogenase (short-subunit alcohol dehydrogenase family)
MEQVLKDKVVAVTGGLGALGQAVVRALRAAGARVAVLDRVAAPAAPPEPGVLVQGGIDLADGAQADAALERAAAELGGLDALVNIAGTFRFETLEQGSVETWDFLYRVNLRTAVSTSKAALPHLKTRGGGRIVNIGAGAAAKAGAGMGPYAASKSAVARLTESLAEELKDQGVNVNAVLPSIIDTAQNRADMPKADFSRWVAPEALADVIVFLISPASRAVTGALIPVSGRV